MAKRLRIGFMGATWPCRSHAKGFAALPGAKLAAVAEPDRGKRRAFRDAVGPLREFDDYRAMIEADGLDAVVVGLPTGMHFDATRASLEAGLHVLCEKPPTTNCREMIRVARMAKRKRLAYMFCRQPRFTPQSLAARRLVAAGRIGEVYHAEARWYRARGIPLGAGGWFVNRAKGGGVLLDLGIHAIDNAWFVMGCPRPVEAFAGLHCAFSHLAPKGVEYTAEDAAVGMIRFENGATLDFTVTFALNTAGPDAANVNGSARPEWGEVRIYGDKGGVDVTAGKFVAGRRRNVKVSALPIPAKPLPIFVAQAKDFLRAVRSGTEPTNSAGQAVMLMQMLDALRKSGDTRRAVRISAPRA